MRPTLRASYEVLILNTRLFLNCLDGVDDRNAQFRLTRDTNHMAFVACHLVDARFYLGTYLGLGLENPLRDRLEGVRTIDELQDCPRLDEIRWAWRYVSEKLAARFQVLSDEDLIPDGLQTFPIADKSVLGGIAFLLQHDSYHVGQLGFLRKALGFPPMSYDISHDMS